MLIYSISNEPTKREAVQSLLQQPLDFVISTQVINEFAHTCFRKKLISEAEIQRLVSGFFQFFEVAQISESTIKAAFALKSRYQFSWYDSLIVSAALENGCERLFSEDLQSGQTIMSQLKIESPF